MEKIEGFAILLSGSITLLVVSITAHLALLNVYKQILWKKKLEVYERITQSLYYVKTQYSILLIKDIITESDKINTENIVGEMNEACEVGSLIVSEKLISIIQSMELRLKFETLILQEDQSTQRKHFFKSLKIIDKAFPVLIEEFQKDLETLDLSLSEILTKKIKAWWLFFR